MPAACGAKGELVEYGIEGYEVRHGNNVQVGFSLGKAPMWHVKLTLSKGGPLLRGEVGWDRVAYFSKICQWLLLKEFIWGQIVEMLGWC